MSPKSFVVSTGGISSLHAPVTSISRLSLTVYPHEEVRSSGIVQWSTVYTSIRPAPRSVFTICHYIFTAH